jgi:signal transduction histidine kinase
MLRSASIRMAALYSAVFIAAVLVLGVVTMLTTQGALTGQFDDRIRAESASLTGEFQTEGLNGLTQAVQERDRTPGALEYGLEGVGGRPIAGRLAGARARPGWSDLSVAERSSERETIRVYATDLGGYRLLVGGDDEAVEDVGRLLVERFALAALGVVLIGVLGGYGLGRGMARKIAAITQAAEAIIHGDLARRVPLGGAGDDLDQLAATFNRMLDRIEALMESLRQVSNDVAHDLRTPLTRLRTRLEALPSTTGQASDAAISAALADLDAILETFAALLRIAQIEGGARRAGFRPTDLAQTCQTVVEAFAPSAEDAGVALECDAASPVAIEGDPELLTQMLVNLVENGLRHAGSGAVVKVKAETLDTTAVLTIVDNGPGVPSQERERLFDRFYRLERSRSTPGSGLGLALVAAVAKLHGAQLVAFDADPGLGVRVTFARHPG